MNYLSIGMERRFFSRGGEGGAGGQCFEIRNPHTKIRVFRFVFTHQKNTAKIRRKIRTSEYRHVWPRRMATVCNMFVVGRQCSKARAAPRRAQWRFPVLRKKQSTGWMERKAFSVKNTTTGELFKECDGCRAKKPSSGGRGADGRYRRGTSDEVVCCVLAHAFGFEGADDDYGRANEATLPRLRAQARRARALAKVNAFVSRHGLAFPPPISPPTPPPISPPTTSEQQVQVGNVLDWLRRLDSVQRILSHVRLDSTHGTSRTATSPAGLARCRNAADRARRVRLRQAVSAAETAAAQNNEQRALDTPAPHTPSPHH